MAGGKETPRQRMIGILYLVLLGLVALNVSDSVLEAFKNIGTSLSTSTGNTQAGIDNMFLAFNETKMKENPERAAPILKKAEEAKNLIKQLTSKIQEYKDVLTSAGGGIKEETGDIKLRSSTDLSPRLMVKDGRATELKGTIVTISDKLKQLTNNEVSFSLSAEDPAPRGGVKRTWEEINFGKGIPLTAAITALEKINADAKNAESAVVKHIFGKMDQAVVNLDKFAAVAVAPSSYLIEGQPYTAKVFLTAYDSKSNPQITVNGSKLPVIDGQGTYTSRPGVGSHTWKGAVSVQQTDGTVKVYETEPMSFQVAKPSAIVSADAMNVMYIGVDNPISISAPGIPLGSVNVTGSGVSLSRKGDGKFVARVSNPGDISLNVTADIDGKSQNMGSTKFRVKRIPKPTARVAGKEGGAISSAQLRGQTVISASLDNFDFDAKFKVTKFNLYIAKPRVDPIGPYAATGNGFTGQMQSALSGLTAGSVVYIYNIVGIGPDGVAQNLNDISFRVTN